MAAEKPARGRAEAGNERDRDRSRAMSITFFFGKVLLNTDDTLLTRGAGKGLKIYDELRRDARPRRCSTSASSR